MIISCSRKSIEVIAALVMSFGISGAAIAADIPMPTKAVAAPLRPIEAWTFSFTPYAWATSISGSTTVKGVTTDVDASFFDILDHTQFPKDLFQLAAFGEARYGRLGLLMDLAYMKIGIGASFSKTRGTDELNGSLGVSAGLKVQMVIAELAAAYEIARWGSTGAPGSGTAIDIYGGGRAWWQKGDASVAFSGTLNIGDFTRNADGTLSASGTVNWVDPLVGLRLRHQFAPGLNFTASGDVGGFGVGSKFSWQALATLDYEFCRSKNVTWSGMVGYKALFADYSQGSGFTHYEYDMTMYGPVFGVTARF